MSSWAKASAIARKLCELLILARSVLVNVLKPNVAMIVGKKAEMEARAQFAPKYMTPATYNYEIWNQLKQAEPPSRYLPSSPGRPLKRALKRDVIHKSSGTNSIEGAYSNQRLL